MLELDEVSKRYGPVRALDAMSFDVRPGEIVALAGPSGAGKTTALHVIAGILPADDGSVRLHGEDLRNVPAWKRNFALLQESYALYPHMSVFDNIAFPLRAPAGRGQVASEAAIKEVVESVAESLGMEPLLGNRIQHLSGGQRQRVGLARALVRQPRVFLLDEPIAHLDAKLRHWLRGDLRRRLTSMDLPTVWATPDGKEALSVADRIAIVLNGRIAQFGTPREIFLRPATARVAEIVSEPPISLLPASVEDGELILSGFPRRLPFVPRNGTSVDRGDVLLGVRPSSVRLASEASRLPVAASVMAREFTTRETIVSVEAGSQVYRVLTDPFREFDVDQSVSVDWDGAKVYLFEATGDRRLLGELLIRASA